MSIGRTLILKIAHFSLVERMVRRSFLFRPLVRRFVAGETLEEAVLAAEQACANGLLASLDLLGENVASASEAQAATEAYIAMLERVGQSEHRDSINVSIKLTQLGLDQGDDLAEHNFRAILAKAKELGNFVRADMEASEYTERTIQMILRVWPEFQNTGTVLQSYLYRTPEDVQKMIDLGARVRIVKGAYLEPESVAHPTKARVDEAYVKLAKELLCEGSYPAIATHDEKIILELKSFVRERNIPKERFEWQMLYGVRRDLQDQLHAEGYNLRVYVPFGESWYPYFARRLAERPANILFILKAAFRK